MSINGTERSLADWRVAGLVRRRSSQAMDTVSFVVMADVDQPAPLVGGDMVEIRYAGRQWFAGRVVAAGPEIGGNAESWRIQVAGPWWYLANQVFQQTWFIYGGGTSSRGHCLLNLFADGTPMSTRDQIDEALVWARDKAASSLGFVPFQWDKNSFPALSIPYDEVRDVTCAEVVSKQLRWMPDAVAWFDYSTSPPTFRVARRQGLPVVDMDVDQEDLPGIVVTPRYDLQVPAVVIKYERVDEIDGISVPVVGQDAAPSGATGSEWGAFVVTVDLMGFTLNRISATLTSVSLPTNAAAWWQWLKTKEAWLSDSRVSLVEMLGVSRVATSDPDAPVLPLELIEGQVPDWVDASAQQERVDFELRLNVAGEDVVTKRVSVNILTTDAATGTYQSVESFVAGEVSPVGLANALYEAMSPLEWDGTVSLWAEETVSITDRISIGNRLNLLGLRAEWEGMEAVVQEVSEDVDAGTVTLRIGPPTHLGPRDMVDLLRVNRNRFVYTARSARSGASAAPSSIGLGRYTPRENAAAGSIGREKLVIRQGLGSIVLDASMAGSMEVTLKEVAVCVNGVQKRMLVLCSDPYDG